MYIEEQAGTGDDAENVGVSDTLTGVQATLNTDVPMAWFSNTDVVASRFGSLGSIGAGVVVVGRVSTVTVTSTEPLRGGVPLSVAVAVRM